MGKRTIKVCDGCDKEIKSSQDCFHLLFESERYTDAAGQSDNDYIKLDFCSACAHDIKETLNNLEDKIKYLIEEE